MKHLNNVLSSFNLKYNNAVVSREDKSASVGVLGAGAIMGVSAMNPVFAAGSFNDIVNSFTTQLKTLRAPLLTAGVAIAVLIFIIAAIVFVTSKDDKKVASAKAWMIRIGFGVALMALAALVVQAFLKFGNDLSGNDKIGEGWK